MAAKVYRSNGKLVASAGPVGVNTYPVYATVMDDEFEGLALDAKWSWFNQGSATATLSNGAVVLSLPTEATGTWRGIQQTLPAGNWRFASRIATGISANNSQTSCMSIRENSSAKTLVIMRSYTGSTYQWAVNYYTDNTTFSSSLWSSTTLISSGWQWRDWGYFAIEYDGTNYYFELSSDGINWVRVTSAAKASYFTADRIALAIRNGNSGQTFSKLVDWFRRVS